jgi:hypothetical protein
MGIVITLPFNYQGVNYYLLIQIKKMNGVNKYHVTAITEKARSKIYGSYIFKRTDNSICLESGPAACELDLIEKIASTLESYLLNNPDN